MRRKFSDINYTLKRTQITYYFYINVLMSGETRRERSLFLGLTLLFPTNVRCRKTAENSGISVAVSSVNFTTSEGSNFIFTSICGMTRLQMRTSSGGSVSAPPPPSDSFSQSCCRRCCYYCRRCCYCRYCCCYAKTQWERRS
jgi:hypothetical protein